MTRPTRAAKVLAQQILEHWEDAAVAFVGEPDGLGVIRALQVEEPVAEPLFNALMPIAELDRRITSLELKDDGPLVINFATDRHADIADKFPLAQVLRVQNPPQTDEEPPQEPEQPKAGAKSTKTAKKASAAKKPVGDEPVEDGEE